MKLHYSLYKHDILALPLISQNPGDQQYHAQKCIYDIFLLQISLQLFKSILFENEVVRYCESDNTIILL